MQQKHDNERRQMEMISFILVLLGGFLIAFTPLPLSIIGIVLVVAGFAVPLKNLHR